MRLPYWFLDRVPHWFRTRWPLRQYYWQQEELDAANARAVEVLRAWNRPKRVGQEDGRQ